LEQNGINIEDFYKELIGKKPEILIDLPRKWHNKINME